MAKSRFASQADAKKAGWFSRRHESSAEMMKARAKWQATKSSEAKRENAALLGMARTDRTVAEQLAAIERRPGKSAREVARLTLKK